MPKVTRQAWTDNPKHQVRAAKEGSCVFSHPDSLPLLVSVVKQRWFWQQKIIVTTLEPIWYSDAVSTSEIEANFTSDLASIPSILWWIVSPIALAVEGLFHDRDYREQVISRRYADFRFLNLMEIRKVPAVIRYPVWAAVRLFGGKAWRLRTEQKRRAERADLMRRVHNSECRINLKPKGKDA